MAEMKGIKNMFSSKKYKKNKSKIYKSKKKANFRSDISARSENKLSTLGEIYNRKNIRDRYNSEVDIVKEKRGQQNDLLFWMGQQSAGMIGEQRLKFYEKMGNIMKFVTENNNINNTIREDTSACSSNSGKKYYFVYKDGTKLEVSPYYYHKAAYLVYRNKKPPTDPKQRREYYDNLANLRRTLNDYK